MDYHLMISPDLDLSPSDILAAWNADASARDVAQARLTQPSTKHYDPTITAIVTLVSSVGVGVLTNALYDVLKAAILKNLERWMKSKR